MLQTSNPSFSSRGCSHIFAYDPCCTRMRTIAMSGSYEERRKNEVDEEMKDTLSAIYRAKKAGFDQETFNVISPRVQLALNQKGYKTVVDGNGWKVWW